MQWCHQAQWHKQDIPSISWSACQAVTLPFSATEMPVAAKIVWEIAKHCEHVMIRLLCGNTVFTHLLSAPARAAHEKGDVTFSPLGKGGRLSLPSAFWPASLATNLCGTVHHLWHGKHIMSMYSRGADLISSHFYCVLRWDVHRNVYLYPHYLCSTGQRSRLPALQGKLPCHSLRR